MPATNGVNVAAPSWSSLPNAMQQSVSGLQKALDHDAWWQAFMDTKAIIEPATIGVQSTGGHDAILVNVTQVAKTKAYTGDSSKADFTLAAKPKPWEKFFAKDPQVSYTSFVGLQKNINNQRWTKTISLADISTSTHQYGEDARFSTRNLAMDSKEIVFLHTASSDSCQYHGIMNNKRMMEKCTMIAFDLLAHGRSFPSKSYVPGNHTNTEDSYVGAIREVVKTLKLNKPIICGASMVGQVCVSVAIRVEEVGAGGTISLQGCDYLAMDRQFNDKSLVLNQSLYNPDWIYGMMAPKSPAINKLLIWHLYSAQAYGIFHANLDFYFGGFDACSRVKDIDTKK